MARTKGTEQHSRAWFLAHDTYDFQGKKDSPSTNMGIGIGVQTEL